MPTVVGGEAPSRLSVVLRVRPLPANEGEASAPEKVGSASASLPGEGGASLRVAPDGPRVCVSVAGPRPGAAETVFSFDAVFSDDAPTSEDLSARERCTGHLPNSQEAVFEHVGKPQCEAALQGFSASVIAYGQTGTPLWRQLARNCGGRGVLLKERLLLVGFSFFRRERKDLHRDGTGRRTSRRTGV